MIYEGGPLGALTNEINIIYILMEYEVDVYEWGTGKCVSSWKCRMCRKEETWNATMSRGSYHLEAKKMWLGDLLGGYVDSDKSLVKKKTLDKTYH